MPYESTAYHPDKPCGGELCTSYDPDHLKIDNLDLFQDDDDWTEYWIRVPAFRDIKFCHSLHHMSGHQNLPLVDILHKTSFSIDIKHTITLDK